MKGRYEEMKIALQSGIHWQNSKDYQILCDIARVCCAISHVGALVICTGMNKQCNILKLDMSRV